LGGPTTCSDRTAAVETGVGDAADVAADDGELQAAANNVYDNVTAATTFLYITPSAGATVCSGRAIKEP